MTETDTITPAVDTVTDTPVPLNPNLSFDLSKIGLALVPFTPVSFTGQDAFYAWGRVILYGGIALASYKQNRAIAVVSGSAAGLCVLSSLAGGSWRK